MPGPHRWLLAVLLIACEHVPGQHVGASPVFTERAARRASCRGELREAIDAGVGWLCAHQAEDGYWSPEHFMHRDPAADRCDGAGREFHVHGVTALALLAVLAQADEQHAGACRRAADWLVGQLDGETGRLDTDASDAIYSQAIATAALAEAAALFGEARYREAAAKALACIERHRTPGAGFGYTPLVGPNDSSILAWCAAAYASCRHAGIEVASAGFGEALAWLETVTNPDGRVGYQKREEGSARISVEHGRQFPIELVETLTAAALHTRLLAGLAPDDAEAVVAADRLVARPPDFAAPSRDFYYWLHGSTAMSQFDGTAQQKAWNEAVHAALLPNQRAEGSAAGSWDPTGVWGEHGGRVYATAAAVLALSSEHRCGPFRPDDELRASKGLRHLARDWQRGAYGKVASSLDRKGREDLSPADAGLHARVAWLLELAAQRDERRLRTLVAAEAEDVRLVLQALESLADRWQGHELGDRASARFAACRAEPGIEAELAALDAIDGVTAAYEKALRGNPGVRRRMHDKLVKLAEKHAGTKAGQRLLEMAGRLH